MADLLHKMSNLSCLSHFTSLSSLLYSTRSAAAAVICFQDSYSAVQSQKAVSAYFTSKQILPFGFAEQH